MAYTPEHDKHLARILSNKRNRNSSGKKNNNNDSFALNKNDNYDTNGINVLSSLSSTIVTSSPRDTRTTSNSEGRRNNNVHIDRVGKLLNSTLIKVSHKPSRQMELMNNNINDNNNNNNSNKNKNNSGGIDNNNNFYNTNTNNLDNRIQTSIQSMSKEKSSGLEILNRISYSTPPSSVPNSYKNSGRTKSPSRNSMIKTQNDIFQDFMKGNGTSLSPPGDNNNNKTMNNYSNINSKKNYVKIQQQTNDEMKLNETKRNDTSSSNSSIMLNEYNNNNGRQKKYSPPNNNNNHYITSGKNTSINRFQYKPSNLKDRPMFYVEKLPPRTLPVTTTTTTKSYEQQEKGGEFTLNNNSTSITTNNNDESRRNIQQQTNNIKHLAEDNFNNNNQMQESMMKMNMLDILIDEKNESLDFDDNNDHLSYTNNNINEQLKREEEEEILKGNMFQNSSNQSLSTISSSKGPPVRINYVDETSYDKRNSDNVEEGNNNRITMSQVNQFIDSVTSQVIIPPPPPSPPPNNNTLLTMYENESLIPFSNNNAKSLHVSFQDDKIPLKTSYEIEEEEMKKKHNKFSNSRDDDNKKNNTSHDSVGPREIEAQRQTIRHLRQRVDDLEHELRTFKSKRRQSRLQREAQQSHRSLLLKGGVFLKHGRRGFPKARVVWVSPDFKKVCWRPIGVASNSNRKGIFQSKRERCIETMSISDVISGAASEVFSRSKKALDIASFTLLTKNSSRTLDLEVQHADISTEHGAEIIQQERDAWVRAFEELLSEIKEENVDDAPFQLANRNNNNERTERKRRVSEFLG